MPLYDYTCKNCRGSEKDIFVHKREDEVRCTNCGDRMMKLFPNRLGPANFGWPEDGVTMENCEKDPVHFKTRSEAKKYAREHNVDLGCL